MDYKPIDINIKSSHTFKTFHAKSFFFKNRSYVVVSMVGSSRSSQETPSGKYHGKRTIKWDFPMRFYVENSMVQDNRLLLVCQIRSGGILGLDKVVGEVHVPVKELLDKCNDGNDEVFTSYEVMKPGGKHSGGYLVFSYKFGKTIRSRAPAIKNDDHGDSATASPRPLPSAPYIASLITL